MAQDLQILSAENGMIWLNNVPIAQATGINIEHTVTTEDVYVIGQQDPVDTIVTKTSTKGTLTLLRTQFDALQRSIPKGRSLTQALGAMLQFNYLSTGSILMTHQVNKLRFTSIKMDVKGGEAFKEVPLEFVAQSISFNIGQ